MVTFIMIPIKIIHYIRVMFTIYKEILLTTTSLDKIL